MKLHLNALLQISFFDRRIWEGVNCSNLDCSIIFPKCYLLDKKKYAVQIYHFVFKQLIKKVQLQNFWDRKKSKNWHDMYGILFWFSNSFNLFCYLLNICRAIAILMMSSFFEQMNFEQMTISQEFNIFLKNFLSQHSKMTAKFDTKQNIDSLKLRSLKTWKFPFNLVFDSQIFFKNGTLLKIVPLMNC